MPDMHGLFTIDFPDWPQILLVLEDGIMSFHSNIPYKLHLFKEEKKKSSKKMF